MKYVYTATFITGDDGTVYARVPDLLGCITTGKDLPDAIEQITDAASVWLVVAEDDGEVIPASTPQKELSISPDMECSLIQIDTLEYRALTDTKAVRKSVSIPCWMAVMADKRGINCSKILQDGLRQQLA